MKTACEEAADFLSDDYSVVGISARKKLIAHPRERETLTKRLRAEGRELRRLRTLICLANHINTTSGEDRGAIKREAARIQKASKK